MDSKEIQVSFVLANYGLDAAREFEAELRQRVDESGDYEIREKYVEPGVIYASAFDWATIISGLTEDVIFNLAMYATIAAAKAAKKYWKKQGDNTKDENSKYLVLYPLDSSHVEKVLLDGKTEEEIAKEVSDILNNFKE